MRLVLTGAAGFIAQAVKQKLQAHDPVVLWEFDSFEAQVHGPGRELPRCGEWQIPQADVVIHLAAKVGVGQSMTDPVDYVACNTLDTAKFLHNMTAKPPKRLVVASSMSVYGEGPRDLEDEPASIPVEEWHPPDLRSIYALTKYDQEQLCLIWGQAHGVPVVALRFFNVYGPGQALSNPYTGVMAIFASRLLNEQAPVVYEDGQQTRDFIHVSDVAEAVVHAALNDIPAGIYNVGTGVPRTIESVAVDLAEALHMDMPPVITNTKRVGDIRHCYADASKLRATGWEPKVAWEDGLRGYVEWLKGQPKPVDRFKEAAGELERARLVR